MADDENRREMARLWRVWKTAKQMVYDRVSRQPLRACATEQTLTLAIQGYELAEDELDVSLDDFRELCGDGSGAAKYESSQSLTPNNLLTRITAKQKCPSQPALRKP